MMTTTGEVSHILLLLVALLQMATPSSAQSISTISTISTASTIIITSTTRTTNTTSHASPAAPDYSTAPVNLTVAVGEPAIFSCGVPVDSPTLSLTLYGSQHQFTLTCPNGHVEDVPLALYGSCSVRNGESLAVWTLSGTSFSDNGTKVMCHQSDNPVSLVAVLQVYDNGASYAMLIGCLIGGFFGVLLVCGLFYLMLWKSDKFQRCFGEEEEDDSTMVVTEDSFKRIES